MRKNNIIVAHAGKQHSFKLVDALKKNSRLRLYITTVYLKKNNLTGFIEKKVNGDLLNRVRSRRNNNLEDFEVKQVYELLGIINLLLLRIDKSRKYYIKWSNYLSGIFGRKVAKYVKKEKAEVIVMYDTSAYSAFKILKETSPHVTRILDVSSATHRYMKNIYLEDIKRTPDFSENLLKSSDYFWDEKILSKYTEEVLLADYFLAPSNFVKKSLEYLGVKSDRIFLCPYGVDVSKFNIMHKKKSKKLRCVYVGSVTQRKGISYLLKALENYDPSEVSLTIIGQYNSEEEQLKKYLDKYEFKGFLPHEKVADILSESDVMVFPSLSEGYSLAVLEALGAGIPVICTENVGAAEAITNYSNGFIVPVGDVDSIRERIDWFLSNLDKIDQMRENARETALSYTWDAYNKRIENIMRIILKEI